MQAIQFSKGNFFLPSFLPSFHKIYGEQTWDFLLLLLQNHVKIPVNTCGVGSMKWLTAFCHRNLLVCGSLDISMSCFLVVGVSLIASSSLQRATPNCMKEAFWGRWRTLGSYRASSVIEGLSPETTTEMRVVLDSETERTWLACNKCEEQGQGRRGVSFVVYEQD